MAPLPKDMRVSELHTARLVLLKTDIGVEEVDVVTGKEVLTQNPGALGTLVFVVRLAEGELNGFHLRSIVKETGIDDEGLKEFITEYFPYVCYKDQDRVFYKNLGSGTMSLGFNPMNMIKLIMNSKKMMKDFNVSSWNTKGEETSREGLLQGGWILFDTDGIPLAAFQEDAKKRIPIDKIIEEAKMMSVSKK
eukprot:scaffold16518_cov139-Skeletonema_marinoi.AAC.12